MISDMVQKVLGWLALVLLLLAVGYSAAAAHYAPKVAALKATIDAADKAARELKKQQEVTAREIEKTNSDRVAAIHKYYGRLLRNVPAQDSDGPITPSSTGLDGAASESTAIGCSLEFREACTLDANKVIGWQVWALRNNIPVQ